MESLSEMILKRNSKQMTICIKSLIKNMNKVVGCSIGCSYCYARNNCRRFHITDDFSVPEYMARKRRIIDTLVNSVYVYDDGDKGRKLVLTFNISGNNTLTISSSDIERTAPLFLRHAPHPHRILSVHPAEYF